MTIFQIFKRFLKENDLYGYYLNSFNDKFNYYSKYRKTLVLGSLLEKPDEAIMSAFQYDKLFAGYSYSPKRKRLYSLNKKWKNFLKKHVVLQTNIDVGDVVYDTDGRLCKVVRQCSCFWVETEYLDNGHFHSKKLCHKIKIEGKEKVYNFYIKNREKCYGKIDGNFNEIQLQ